MIGVGITRWGGLSLVFREKMLKVLARGPGTLEGTWRYRVLAQFNGLVLPIVLVAVGIITAVVGIVRLA